MRLIPIVLTAFFSSIIALTTWAQTTNKQTLDSILFYPGTNDVYLKGAEKWSTTGCSNVDFVRLDAESVGLHAYIAIALAAHNNQSMVDFGVDATSCDSVNSQVTANWIRINGDSSPVVPPNPGAGFASCKALKASDATLSSGVYTINTTAGASIEVYCDMETEGGGWTLVAAQFELDPALSWNEGIQSDYDPTLASEKSFTLSAAELPADRSETGFGKSLDPTFIDYVNMVYTTGNIDKTLLVGKKNGVEYHTYRNVAALYNLSDPENIFSTNPAYSQSFDSFGFDEVGGVKYTWAFDPRYGIQSYRGSQIGGQNLRSTIDPFAWTVWVR